MKNPTLTLFMSWLWLWSGCGQFMAADAMRLLTGDPPFSKNPLSALTDNDPFGFDFSQMDTFLNNPQAMLHKPRLMVNLLTQLGQWSRQVLAYVEQVPQFHQMKIGIHDIHRFVNEHKHDMFRAFNVDQKTRQLMNRANDELLEFGIRHNCGEIFNNLGNRKLGFGCDSAPSGHGRHLMTSDTVSANTYFALKLGSVMIGLQALWTILAVTQFLTRGYHSVFFELMFTVLRSWFALGYVVMGFTTFWREPDNQFYRQPLLLWPYIFVADLMLISALPAAYDYFVHLKREHMLRDGTFFRDADPPVVEEKAAEESNENEIQENITDNQKSEVAEEEVDNEIMAATSEMKPTESADEIQPADATEIDTMPESEEPSIPMHECPFCFEKFQHGVEVNGNCFKQFYGCSHGACRECLEQKIRNGMRTCFSCSNAIMTKSQFAKKHPELKAVSSDGLMRGFMQRMRQHRSANNEIAVPTVQEEIISNDIEAPAPKDNHLGAFVVSESENIPSDEGSSSPSAVTESGRNMELEMSNMPPHN